MGKLYVVGIGPGDGRYLTEAARAALEEADVLCGYTLYVELLKPLWPEKATYSTGMTGEIERCRWCLEQAAGNYSGYYGILELDFCVGHEHVKASKDKAGQKEWHGFDKELKKTSKQLETLHPGKD